MTYLYGAVATVIVLAGCVGLELASRTALSSAPYDDYARARVSFSETRCTATTSDQGQPICVAGDLDAGTTVVLVGDSHAGHWMAAFGEAGERLGVRVVLRQAGNCSAIQPPQPPARSRATLEGCHRFQSDTADYVTQERPAAIVLSDALGSRDLLFEGDRSAWADAFVEQVSTWQADGIAVGFVRDNPAYGDPLLCLARGRDETSCTPKRRDAVRVLDEFAPYEGRALSGAAEPVPLLDLTDDICGPELCPIESNGAWVFAGTSHLTLDYTLTQSAPVEELVRSLLDQGVGT